MLCGSRRCGCAIQAGQGANLSGSGSAADPWVFGVEDPTLTGKVVYRYDDLAELAVDFPSPALDMTALFTVENRIMRWNGTAWKPHFGGMAIVSRTAALTVPTATVTTIPFTGTDIFDPLNWHDPAVNSDRVSPGHAGNYLVIGSVTWQTTGAAGVWIQAQPMLNGAAAGFPDQETTTPGGRGANTIAQPLTTAADSDYFGLRVYHETGSDRTVTARLSVIFLSPP